MTNSPQELAERLARIERMLASGRYGGLGHSSFEGGGITQYTPDGAAPVARFGEHFDGTNGSVTLTSPPPPVPRWTAIEGPEAETAIGGIRFRWEGRFEPDDFTIAPLGFTHVELHVSDQPDLDALTSDTLKTTINTARGGEALIPLPPNAGGYYARLVARNNAGKRSDPSAVIGPFQPIGVEEISGNTIHRGPTEPTGEHKFGDLWLKTPENIAHRWEPDGTPHWEPTADERIADALEAAFEADGKATQAGIDALAAQGTAGAAADLAATKTTTFSQPSQPPTTGRTLGDEWIDTDDGNKRYVWDGAWTAKPLGAAAIGATARQLGAITTYRQAAAPTSGMVVGDFWIDSDDNKLYRYEGTTPSWVAVQDTAIQSAVQGAADARAVADGKMRIYTQADAPTGLADTDDGDLWIETDNGNRTYRWSRITSTERTNLVRNPAAYGDPVDISAAGWWVNNGTSGVSTIARVATGGPLPGVPAFMRMTWTTASTGGNGGIYAGRTGSAVTPYVIPVTAGKTYTASLYVRSSVARSMMCRLYWYDASGANISVSDSPAVSVAANTWTQLSHTTAPPAGAVRVVIGGWAAVAGANFAVGNTLDGSAAMVEEGPTLGSYFDGNSGGEAIWNGDPNAASSTTWEQGTAASYSWVPQLIRSAAIQPQSLVARDVVATGTVSAALLEAILVIANVMIAGDPLGEHTRIESSGITNYAMGDDGLPMELGRQGRGWSVRDPASGEVTASATEAGELAVKSLSTIDPDPSFGGTQLSEMLRLAPRGLVAWGKYPSIGGISATTNTELGFMELSFERHPERMYAVFIEPTELSNQTDPGGAWLRVRSTADGSPPTVTSTLVRQWNRPKGTDGSWNEMIPNYFLYAGTVAGTPVQEVRFLLSYAVGTGSQVSAGTAITRNQNFYFWVEDIGPLLPETGDETGGGGTVASGTPPPGSVAVAKKQYTYQQTANWVRTWNQSNSVIYDDEMHQGYGDSFNGIRKSAAGWTNIPSMTGATVDSIEVYMESYHWWNMSGGTLYMGYHNVAAEGASMPATTGFQSIAFTARSQGKWINVTSAWKSALAANGLKGIGITGPSTSATYYGKFRGPANARPQLRIKYTK